MFWEMLKEKKSPLSLLWVKVMKWIRIWRHWLPPPLLPRTSSCVFALLSLLIPNNSPIMTINSKPNQKLMKFEDITLFLRQHMVFTQWFIIILMWYKPKNEWLELVFFSFFFFFCGSCLSVGSINTGHYVSEWFSSTPLITGCSQLMSLSIEL